MLDFEGKVVIVTGASGNLGGAVASEFSKVGALLALPDRGKGRLQKVLPQIGSEKMHFLADSIDLIKEDSINSFVESVIDRYGRIDVLVNTVGGYKAGAKPHKTSLEVWELMNNLNARTTFISCRAVIPQMIEQGYGKIVNTAARSALLARASDIAYSASKSAVLRITESMSSAYKRNGINVNCVLPGTLDTKQNREAMPDADASKWVSLKDIAKVYLFLSSEWASVIHGAIIPAYGLS